MKKFNLSKVFNRGLKALGKRSPEILTAIGIVGMVSSTIMAVEETIRAVREVDKERQRRIDEAESVGAFPDPSEVLDTKDVVKLVWTYYIPAGVTCIISTGCLIGANALNSRQKATLSAMYTLSETAFRGYREKVIETIGETREREVHDEYVKERTKKPIKSSDRDDREPVILYTTNGDVMCWDAEHDRYFMSNKQKIKNAENVLNKRMRRDEFVSLNDFYYEVRAKNTDYGDRVGWNTQLGDIDVCFIEHLDDNDNPCLGFRFSPIPKSGYQNIHR